MYVSNRGFFVHHLMLCSCRHGVFMVVRAEPREESVLPSSFSWLRVLRGLQQLSRFLVGAAPLSPILVLL